MVEAHKEPAAAAEEEAATPPETPAAAPTRDAGPWLRVALAALVLLSAVGASTFALYADRARQVRTPSPEALDAAAAVVRNGFARGDGVMVLPNWDESLWDRLTGMGPGTETWPYPAFYKGDVVDPVDLLRFERVWVVATFDKVARIPAPGLEDLAADLVEEPSPHIQIARYTLPKLDVRARMTERLEELEATRQRLDGDKRRWNCPFRGGRLRCNTGEAWRDIHLARRDVFHREVEWAYVHAGPGHARVTLRWPNAPAGRAVMVRMGWTQEATRREGGEALEIRISVNDREIDALLLEPYDYVLERRLLPLSADRRNDIRVEIVSTKDDFRQLMMEMDVLGEVPGSVRAWATHDGL